MFSGNTVLYLFCLFIPLGFIWAIYIQTDLWWIGASGPSWDPSPGVLVTEDMQVSGDVPLGIFSQPSGPLWINLLQV